MRYWSEIQSVCSKKSDYVIVCRGWRDNNEYKTDVELPTYFIESIIDGSRKLVCENLTDGSNSSLNISPSGKYVYYYDKSAEQLFVYNIQKGLKRGIGAGVPFQDNNSEDTALAKNYFTVGGWLAADKALFIHDKYDIWQIDPDSVKAPVNITKGQGRKKQIVFRLLNVTNGNDKQVFDPNETLLLSAFDPITKDNGFYSQKIRSGDGPWKLIMEPCIYALPYRSFATWYTDEPLIYTKAREANAYLVRRMSETEAPNFYWTADFKKFQKISDVEPFKDYNWLTTELINYRMLDGRMSQGILYKPENFDKSKKYPVIFYMYEQLSDGLHQFKIPGFSTGPLDIPTYVSNDYLIFVPDIYYKTGWIGESVVNSVVAAARQLSRLSFVDSTKMGLQGHSFGAYEVNYLITHTNMFAAACEASGKSDLVSGYLNLFDNLDAATHFYETGQNRMGTTLWDDPRTYIRNSPVFNANAVTTPLLMMNNKNDNRVPFFSRCRVI